MYVYVKKYGNKVYVTEYDKNWNKKIKTISPKPELFISSNKKTEYKSYPSMKPVERVTFESISEMREFKENISSDLIHGHAGRFHNEFYYIRDSGQYQTVDASKLNIAYIDIEVYSPDEFPEANEANHPITSLCIIESKTDNSIIWGLKDYKRHKDNIEYRLFSNESDMMYDFCKTVGENQYDVMIGWNSIKFDFPYIYNRCKQIIPKHVKLMSPFKKVIDKPIRDRKLERTYHSCEVFGVLLLDYMELYKKYSLSSKPSYKLDNIAEDELGTNKLDYEDEGSLTKLYNQNHQKYIEYEYKDTEIVRDLDSKMGLINRIFGLGHYARMPIDKVLSPVCMWESIMFNKLIDDKMVFPPSRKSSDDDEGFEGAYVKQPVPGIHGWFASFDVNSEHPHTIIFGNMSPETKITMAPDIETAELCKKMNVESIVNMELDFECAKRNNIFVAANGCMFSKDVKGVGPIMMETLYKQRSEHRNDMRALIKKKMDNTYNGAELEEIDSEISRLDNLQWSEKIVLNAFYGAFSNKYFRFYDRDIAEAISLTAQAMIRTSERQLNIYLNNKLKTNNKNYVIYVDTDSNYVSLVDFVDLYLKKKPSASIDDVTNFLDKICQQMLEPKLESIFTNLYDYMNGYIDCMVMKREVIAKCGLWIKKKKYAMMVVDDEGKRYKEPELKIKGIQVVRSDTPKSVKPYLSTFIGMLLGDKKTDIRKYIKDTKIKLKKLSIGDLAISKGLNGYEKYAIVDETGAPVGYRSRCPIQVRAAIMHNAAVIKKGMKGKINDIKSGDSIKYIMLREKNPTCENVIGFIDKLPKTFGLDKYVDKTLQIEKIFGKIVTDICDILKIPTRNTLF